jgi:hypothetical protein
MKISILIPTFLLAMIFTSSCKDHVKINLDKKEILTGETITARLYVKNLETILPSFYIVRELDTAILPIDRGDKDCGVYMGTSRTPGKREVKGYVDYVDKNNKRQILDYEFRFNVLETPGIPKK